VHYSMGTSLRRAGLQSKWRQARRPWPRPRRLRPRLAPLASRRLPAQTAAGPCIDHRESKLIVAFLSEPTAAASTTNACTPAAAKERRAPEGSGGGGGAQLAGSPGPRGAPCWLMADIVAQHAAWRPPSPGPQGLRIGRRHARPAGTRCATLVVYLYGLNGPKTAAGNGSRKWRPEMAARTTRIWSHVSPDWPLEETQTSAGAPPAKCRTPCPASALVWQHSGGERPQQGGARVPCGGGPGGRRRRPAPRPAKAVPRPEGHQGVAGLKIAH
jgi:hypothetical protein